MAMGCSSNPIIHPVAMSLRAGHAVTLDDFGAASRRVPVIAHIRPSGDSDLMEDFFYAGGLPALLQRIAEHRATMPLNEGFLARDMAFHREIARISGNPIFPAVVEAIFQWASAYDQPLVRAPGAEALTLEEHTRLVDAIAAGDPDAAEHALRSHLTRSNELYHSLAQARRHEA